MSHKKLTATKKQLEKYLEAGMTYGQIANLFGAKSVNSVIAALKREGLFDPRQSTEPKAVVTVKLAEEELEMLGGIRKHYKLRNTSESIRKAIRVTDGVVKEAKPPR